MHEKLFLSLRTTKRVKQSVHVSIDVVIKTKNIKIRLPRRYRSSQCHYHK